MKISSFLKPALFGLTFLIAAICWNCNPPATPLTFANKNWQLTTLQKEGTDMVLPADFGFNLRFEDGRISGKGACNYLGFYYQWRYADSVSVFGGDQTMMACEPEERMTWDDRFVAEMLKVRALHWIDTTNLELRCYDGGKIFFKQTNPTQE